MPELTQEQIDDIWRRRRERALRWRWSDGSLAPGYPTCSLEEENEHTLNAMPPIEPASHRKKKKAEEE